MIISRTPFRISFLGGGSDLPSFYQEEEGAVISTTINKYMYITVNDRFDRTYRLAYSETEIRDQVDEIDHKIFKNVLKKYSHLAEAQNGGRGLELISMADIPGGTGLGSSSTFTVGLLHALKAHLGLFQSAETLAAEAARIEVDELGEPIGKQDQYAAAYGGLQFIRFCPSGEISCEPIICSDNTKRALEASVLLLYTGITRPASKILSEQKSNISSTRVNLRAMVNLAWRMKNALEQNKSISHCGELLDEGWRLKKTLASGISDPQIDEWYERAKEAGAWGGKILGAGGGGFLMLLSDPDKQTRIKAEMRELTAVATEFESFGSKIIFVG